MQNGAIIYKCKKPMNGYCSKSMKSQKELPNVERNQNAKPSMGAVKCA